MFQNIVGTELLCLKFSKNLKLSKIIFQCLGFWLDHKIEPVMLENLKLRHLCLELYCIIINFFGNMWMIYVCCLCLTYKRFTVILLHSLDLLLKFKEPILGIHAVDALTRKWVCLDMEVKWRKDWKKNKWHTV
jgi:hypothetical protein